MEELIFNENVGKYFFDFSRDVFGWCWGLFL